MAQGSAQFGVPMSNHLRRAPLLSRRAALRPLYPRAKEHVGSSEHLLGRCPPAERGAGILRALRNPLRMGRGAIELEASWSSRWSVKKGKANPPVTRSSTRYRIT